MLQGTLLASLASVLGLPRAAVSLQRNAARPLPMTAVRLQPSPWLSAVESNRAYLHPPRTRPAAARLSRCRPGSRRRAIATAAGRQETIAGHSLGHYLSACALMHAQTGDVECRARAHYIVGELGDCQRAGRDGFVGAFTRRDEASGTIEPGRRVMRGDRPWRHPFRALLPERLLGAVLQLAQAVRRPARRQRALRERRMRSWSPRRSPAFIERTLAGLDAAQMQSVLGTEFGGMSEVLAELSGAHRRRALARARGALPPPGRARPADRRA